ncbi:MAG: aldose 1-epimerase family protein, partial [Eubacterium sp.]
TWQVNNKDSKPIYFTIGAHPAYRFREGDKKEDYILMFNKKDSLEYMLLDSEYGTAVDSKKYQLPLNNGQYRLNEKIFENDAL